MDWGKVVYVFFTLMSLTTAAGFLYHNDPVYLYIATGVNLISTLLKVGVRNLLSAELLAASLVADLHLVPAFFTLLFSADQSAAIALTIGAVIANIATVAFFLIESAKTKEDI
ncbi:hypothetical protein AGMMS49521_4570 [Campylobacterota bacterium]|nr:hypothetical protein AGMMS49521_4570 [Campylobacterota bacterium]GHV06770.1 hypothetical protein AGMMS50229_12180 [Campylobacterota bacterium]